MRIQNIFLSFIVCLIIVSCNSSADKNAEVQSLIDDKLFKQASGVIFKAEEGEIASEKIFEVARVYSERTNFNISVPLLEKALVSDSSNVPAKLLLANNYREQSKFNESMKIYNELVEIDSLQFLILPERARLYVQLQEFDKAKADIKLAKELEPNYFATYLAHGLLKNAEGDIEVALELFEEAERLDPGVSAEAPLYAGFILLSSKINLDAMHKFTKAIDVRNNINVGYAFINRGVCQFNLTDTAFACTDWDSALFYMPEQAQTYIDNYCKDWSGELKNAWQKSN